MMISLNKLKLRNEIGKQKPILKKQYNETRDRKHLIELDLVSKMYNDLMFEIYSIETIEKCYEMLGQDQYVILDDILIEKTENFIIFRDMTDENILKNFDKKYNKHFLSE